MNNDMMHALSELTTITSTLLPEIDIIKLQYRLEEVLNNYNIQKKNTENLEDDMANNIKLYISARKLEGLSENTLDDYQHTLKMFNGYIKKPTINITTNDIRRYLAEQGENMLSTVGKKLSVINGFFDWLVLEDLILKNPAKKIKQLKQPKRLMKALTALELEAIRDACATKRESALIEVLYSTGCRLSEIANIKHQDIDWVLGSIKVIGKGNKERVAYINPKASYHLKQYLQECEINEGESSFIFTTMRRPYRQLSNKSIQDVISKIAKASTVEKKVTPHVFRHTMATLAMENGIELGDLQQLLGHSSPGTTLRYAEVSETRKHSAHKRFVR